mgnify:FL=1
MKLSRYLKDKLYFIILFLTFLSLIILLLVGFKVSLELIIVIISLLVIFAILVLIIEYLKKRNFYNEFINIVDKLDKKYLVIEMLNPPNFQEGEILYNKLYEINKSMLENIKNYEISMNDFKDYIEMWIHEVKIPLSSLILMIHNNKNNISSKMVDQVNRLDNYVDQVLFYVRAENAEKDYLIKKTYLNKVINKIALKNKDYILENNIDFNVLNCEKKVLTDSKWLEFIIDQIINNSIKYKREIASSFIKIYTEKNNEELRLIIYDNGIGIDAKDLPRVFDKTYTGTNGRLKSKSTGMGLYIAKNLCEKLGHKIAIESKVNEYTKVIITFNKESIYDVLD